MPIEGLINTYEYIGSEGRGLYRRGTEGRGRVFCVHIGLARVMKRRGLEGRGLERKGTVFLYKFSDKCDHFKYLMHLLMKGEIQYFKWEENVYMKP